PSRRECRRQSVPAIRRLRRSPRHGAADAGRPRPIRAHGQARRPLGVSRSKPAQRGEDGAVLPRRPGGNARGRGRGNGADSARPRAGAARDRPHRAVPERAERRVSAARRAGGGPAMTGATARMALIVLGLLVVLTYLLLRGLTPDAALQERRL